MSAGREFHVCSRLSQDVCPILDSISAPFALIYYQSLPRVVSALPVFLCPARALKVRCVRSERSYRVSNVRRGEHNDSSINVIQRPSHFDLDQSQQRLLEAAAGGSDVTQLTAVPR